MASRIITASLLAGIYVMRLLRLQSLS
jgi:hypothetical protein